MSYTKAMTKDSSSELREKLAAIEHERWADWQRWVHDVYNKPGLSFKQAVKRWEVQIKTPYEQLSETEKKSDMEQVNRYWPLIEAYVAQDRQELLKRIDKATSDYWLADPKYRNLAADKDHSTDYFVALGHDKALSEVQAIINAIRNEI